MRINSRQYATLDCIIKACRAGEDPHTDDLRLAVPKVGRASTTYDALHGLLVRMEKRGLVKRSGKRFSPARNGMVATWVATVAGGSAWTEYSA